MELRAGPGLAPDARVAGPVVREAGVRVLIGVHGLDEEADRARVHKALMAVPGVLAVEAGDAGQVAVRYDDRRTTVMEMIRALRRLGFLAGME